MQDLDSIFCNFCRCFFLVSAKVFAVATVYILAVFISLSSYAAINDIEVSVQSNNEINPSYVERGNIVTASITVPEGEVVTGITYRHLDAASVLESSCDDGRCTFTKQFTVPKLGKRKARTMVLIVDRVEDGINLQNRYFDMLTYARRASQIKPVSHISTISNNSLSSNFATVGDEITLNFRVHGSSGAVANLIGSRDSTPSVTTSSYQDYSIRHIVSATDPIGPAAFSIQHNGQTYSPNKPNTFNVEIFKADQVAAIKRLRVRENRWGNRFRIHFRTTPAYAKYLTINSITVNGKERGSKKFMKKKVCRYISGSFATDQDSVDVAIDYSFMGNNYQISSKLDVKKRASEQPTSISDVLKGI